MRSILFYIVTYHYCPNTQCRIGLISEVIVIGIVNRMPLFPSLFSQSYPFIFSQKVFAFVAFNTVYGDEIFFQILRFTQNLLCKMLLSVFISYSKKEIAIIFINLRKKIWSFFAKIFHQHNKSVCSTYLLPTVCIYVVAHYFYCISYNN